jgi:hypothetical protein
LLWGRNVGSCQSGGCLYNFLRSLCGLKCCLTPFGHLLAVEGDLAVGAINVIAPLGGVLDQVLGEMDRKDLEGVALPWRVRTLLPAPKGLRALNAVAKANRLENSGDAL